MTQTTIDPGTVETLHGVTDQAKYRQLIESMEDNGWIGAPVVIVKRGDAIPLAITGTHRLAAAEFVGIEVPAVVFRDLVTEAGLDYHALLGEYMEAGFDHYDAIVRIADELPAEVVERYGLDAH